MCLIYFLHISVKEDTCSQAAHFSMQIPSLAICMFSIGVFIMTDAGEFACLHLPLSTLEEIIASLMKA